jgi:Skp family chaperone for outer membrane proteins
MRRYGFDAGSEQGVRRVKKTIAALSGLIVFTGLTTWAGGQTPPNLNPQGQSKVVPASATAPASPTMPGTRVAVLNINSVLKNYAKAQYLNTSIKNEVAGYADRMNKIKEEIAKKQAEMAKPTTTTPQREAMDKEIVAMNRQLQDMDADARKTITAKQGSIAVSIYQEIEKVVEAVAKTNNFDLVLSYPDSTVDSEKYITDNVVRKLASQAAIPLYYKPHIDITNAVIQTLNASFPAPGATPASPAPSAPTPPQGNK